MKKLIFTILLCAICPLAWGQNSPEEKLMRTLQGISELYVDSISKQKIVDQAIASLLNSLDPFSEYLPPISVNGTEQALGKAMPTTNPTGNNPAKPQSAKPASQLKAAYMVNDSTGYIAISIFSMNVSKDFHDAVVKLKKEGMKNLILDIRKNEGGLFDEAVLIADELLGGMKTIVSAEGAHMDRMPFPTSIDGAFEDGRLVVLINNRTKSAAEILGATLQDWDRGVLIGTDSFGKGLIQDTFPFEDGSAIRLTVARYITPAGRSIQKPYEGMQVAPEVGKSVKSMRTGRTLKCGVGVQPDVVVEDATSHLTPWYNTLVYSGVQTKFARDYVNANRRDLQKKYKTPKVFFEKFDATPLLPDVCALAKEANIVFSQQDYDQSAPYLAIQVKGIIARELFGDNNQFYSTMNTIDPIVIKAVEILNDENKYKELLNEKK